MSSNPSDKTSTAVKAKKRPAKFKVITSYKSKKPKADAAPTIVKRVDNREYSIFIDGVALDRACRRLNKKVNYEALVKSLCVGNQPDVARYYTLLPVEDDARQSAFYDAIARAGLDVVKKRLPPKTLNKQVSTEIEMACDILATVLGRQDACKASLEIASGNYSVVSKHSKLTGNSQEKPSKAADDSKPVQKVIVTVCVSKEVSYALNICRHLGAETINADFGQIMGRDILRGAEKWVDLSFSETIWKAEK